MSDDDKKAALNQALLAGNLYGPNPYTQYQGRLPGPTYHGVPTDAMGNPIAQPPGMTLNSTQASAQASAPAAANSPDLSHGIYSMYGGGSAGLPMGQGVPLSQFGGGGYGSQNMNDAAGLASLMGFDPSQLNGFQGQKQQAAPQQAAAPPDNSYQSALDMLSNPGKIVTPGANVPATKPVTDQPSVLDQFLAGQHGGQGAGGYSNQGFFDTLNRLKGMSAT